MIERKSISRLINEGLSEIQGSSAYRNDRKRPYDGQPHTSDGKRGKTKVKELTFRDIKDCFVKGILLSSYDENNHDIYFDKAQNNSWITDDVYQINLSKLDPIAVWINMANEMEKMMGIYPNVPELVEKNK